MKYLLFLILILISVTRISAQDSMTVSKIRIFQDERLEKLEENANKISSRNFRNNNVVSARDEEATVRGYRIQIYSGNDREYANDLRLKFMSSYPQTSCYIQFLSPYYKVRVGDYETSEEANKQLKYFKRVYPSAFIISSYIN